MSMRIRKNNLLPWFTDDHRTLPDWYLKSCRSFDELKEESDKEIQQAEEVLKRYEYTD